MTNNLLVLKKVDDFEEFKKYYYQINKYCYFGYKKIDDVKFQELKEKDEKENFKTHDIYLLQDGFYFIFQNDKYFKINNVIYYDDETPEPNVTENYFIDYNKSNIKNNIKEWVDGYNDFLKNGCCLGIIETHPFINLNYGRSKEVYPIFYSYFGNSRRDKTTVRDLTADEIKDLTTIFENYEKNYIERLKKYYKKYNKKIKTYGYWANR